jgi:hypothetical protein
MTLEEFRHEMESYRRDADAEAQRLKDPWIALERLRILYGRFDESERLMAHQVLGEWLLSEDENLRFDAMALVRDLRLLSAMPALRELAIRLASSRERGAPYELDKVSGLIKELTGERPF